jgi:PII-like signaling protein
MKTEREQLLLRIYLRNTDRHGTQTAAEAVVEQAQRHGLAGATLIRGRLGLDFDGKLLESRVWSLVEHLPVIVEVIDTAAAIGPFLTVIERVLPDAVLTLERAHVMLYRHAAAPASQAAERLAVPAPIAPLSTLPSPEEFPMMKLSEEGQLLRVFIGESDTWQGQPLYRAIVLKARELGLAGATVLHGAMGFGASSRMHTSKLLELSTDLPVVIEIVDSAERIDSLLPFLDQAVTEGLITIEGVRILKYRHNPEKARH